MSAERLAIVMVGLPARGKTYVARKLARYLNWLGYRTRVFNVGEYRRRELGARQRQDFFRPDNLAGKEQRLRLAMAALDDLFAWMDEGGQIAVYDATNTTRARRDLVMQRCEAEGVRMLFIETILSDPSVIEANIRDTKLDSPDYAGISPADAIADFRARIAHYERAYEPVGLESVSYIKRIDGGRQILLNRVDGEVSLRIANYLAGMVSLPQPIWLTRHGESSFNVRGLLGGNPSLSQRGRHYSEQLAEYVRSQEHTLTGLQVWTSSLRRTIQTGYYLERPLRRWRELDEINAGACEGMSYERVAAEMPDEYAARKQDKFHYRYPRGESYEELIQRLDRVVVELERQSSPLLIVSHQAVLRALYAYLKGLPPEQCPHLSIPLHTLIRLTPGLHVTEEERISFDV